MLISVVQQMFPLSDFKDSRRAKVVPFLQKLLTIKEVTDGHPDEYSEDETVKVVLKLAEEMGLKASSLEKSISPASAHSILEKTEEVS